MKKLLLAATVLTLSAISVRADSGSPVYDVTGTIVVSGNSTCPSCSETVNFSFQVTDVNDGFGDYDQTILPNSWSSTSSGTLGTGFSISNPGESRPFFVPVDIDNSEFNYLGLHNGNGNEIDLYLANNATPTPIPLTFGGADLWACETATCIQDFCIPDSTGMCNTLSTDQPESLTANITESGTKVPEPRPIVLLLLGIPLLLVVRRVPLIRHTNLNNC